jgi:LacI family transcriptional regulator
MAAAAVAIAHRRGLDVPGDLTVCGFDDTALATTIWPELTTIRQPVFEMSRTAVDLLVKEIARAGSQADTARKTHCPGRLRADPAPVRTRRRGAGPTRAKLGLRDRRPQAACPGP